MSQEQKAAEQIAAAEKKLKAWFGGNSKYEDAAEMYQKAGNLYKMSKNYEEGGNAFLQAAECHIKAKYKYDAASDYINAGNCYKNTNLNKAVNCIRSGVELFAEEGRFSIAAKHQKEIAELCEKELDLEQAIENFKIAADYYEGENATTSANQCLLKVAQFSATLEKYRDAIEIYEKIGENAVDNPLIKFSVKQYFFKAGLCHMANGDTVGARQAIEKYQNLDQTFGAQRECKFLLEILQAYEDYNTEAYSDAVAEFDSISPLDTWNTTILYKIKSNIKEDEDEEELI